MGSGSRDGEFSDFVCHLSTDELAGFVDGEATEIEMCVTLTDGVDTLEISDADLVKLTKTDCL